MKKFAILGHDISYTKSPRMHELIALATNRELQYDIVDVPEEQLAETVERLKKEYDGFNVTKPYKEKVLDYVDVITEPVRMIGSCNTVKVEDGVAAAFNTDNFGFYQSLGMERVVLEKGSKTLILGAGGAAKAVVSVLMTATELMICDRTEARARKMMADMHMREDCFVSRENLKGKYDIIVNTTTLGQNGENCLPEGYDLTGTKYCIDLIYDPKETPFLAAAKEADVRAINGMAMLTAQGIASETIWYGKEFEKAELEEIFRVINSML